MLWDCLEWEHARETWSPWLRDTTTALPSWDRLTSGQPACGGRASSPSGWRRGWSGRSWKSSRTACTACTWRCSPPAWLRAAGTKQATGTPCSRTSRNPFPWGDFVGPLPGAAVRNQPRLRPRAPPGWRWPQDFVQDRVRWARALAWMPGTAEVSWAELALDHQAFVGRALPASPDHRLRGTRLPLGERAQVLRKAAWLVERHLVAGTLLCGAPLGTVSLPLPLGGPCVCRPVGPPVLHGSPRGDAATYSPGNSLPGQGPAPADAGTYTAANGRPFPHGLLPPPP